MFCWNCGKELPEGQRFCGSCGADQSASPASGPRGQGPYSERPQGQGGWSAPAGGPRRDLGGLFTIFGLACAVYFGAFALQGFYGAGSTVLRYLSRLSDGFSAHALTMLMTAALSSGVALVLNLALCGLSLMIAFRRRPENADGLFLCFSGCMLLRMALILLGSLVSVLQGAGVAALQHVLDQFFLTAVIVGILAGITVLSGGPVPLLGKSQAELRLSVHAVWISAQTAAAEAVRGIERVLRSGSAGYGRLKTDRSLVMYLLLNILTCGFYSLYFIYRMAQDVNTACAGDGGHTGGLAAFLLLGFLTCGIYPIFWWYSVANRLASNAPRYGLQFQENGTTVLLWYLLGAFLCGVGPLIAVYIVIKNTNIICSAYNQYNRL